MADSATSKPTRSVVESTVRSNVRVAKDTYLFTITAPEAFFDAFVPGMFAHVRIPHAAQMLLRRPFTVYAVHPKEGTIDILYEVVGGGTEILSTCSAGTTLNVLMPLGNGFTMDESVKNVWLVAGGVACAALGTVPAFWPDQAYRAFFGFRSSEYVVPEQILPTGVDSVLIATDDGSAGEAGLITDIVSEELKASQPDLILTCGPDGMMKALRSACGTQIPVQVSMGERMGCGTGGCDTCVCMVNGEYRNTCTDGPVFRLSEVDEYGG